jgi:glycosyltransferase involved in cell wall biosynthesis
MREMTQRLGMADHVLFTESSPNLGGQELQLMQQMEWMSACGFHTVLACRSGSRVEEVARTKRLTVLPLKFRNSLDFGTILPLRRWMARHQPKLAVCHSGHDTNNVAVAARLMSRRPFLLRSRTYLPGRARAFSYNRLVDATMLPSSYLRDAVLATSSVRPEKLHVVYPGIDFDTLDLRATEALPRPLEEWLARGKGPVLTHAAMLRGEKGHTTLLAALHALRDRWPDVRYVIAGEGPENEALRNEVRRLGLEQRVFMAGLVSPVAALIARSQLLVMPSLYEPLGMSQIEALSLGIPVIASRVGGIPETIDHLVSGLLAEPGNIEDWAGALHEALSDLNRMRSLAQAGRQMVRERFSVQKNFEQILRISNLTRLV